MSVDMRLFKTSTEPQEDNSTFGWEIKRAPAEGTMKLLIYSSYTLGVETHYWLGRTGPCPNLNCAACKAGHRSRWKGYLLAQDLKGQGQIVFEFTPPGQKVLKDAWKQFGTMRGMQIVVGRHGKKANSRVAIQVRSQANLPVDAVPDYSVWPILSRIWGLHERADYRAVELGEDEVIPIHRSA